MMWNCNQANSGGRPSAEPPEETEGVIDGEPTIISQEAIVANDGLNNNSTMPFTRTFPGSSLMAISIHSPSLLEPPRGTSINPSPMLAAGIETSTTGPQGPDITNLTQASKRSRVDEEQNDIKRFKHEQSLPATPSSSPFRTLRITKLSTTRDCWSLQKSDDDRLSLHDETSSQGTGPRHPRGQTTMEQLTPYPTRRLQESENQVSLGAVAVMADGLGEMNGPLLTSGRQSTPMGSAFVSLSASDGKPGGAAGIEESAHLAYTPGPSDARFQHFDELAGRITGPYHLNDNSRTSNDEYPLDDDIAEEDMVCLLDMASDKVQETHIPPSSVTRAWDQDSRSAGEYDQTLQYSSPLPSSAQPRVPRPVGEARNFSSGQDELLDEDVDWNAVYTMVNVSPRASSTAKTQGITHPLAENQTIQAGELPKHNPEVGDAMPPKPFVRASFPEKVPDRCIVSGLSSNTVLRTCFRIGEMVNQIARCLNHRQEVVFELFARVTYSNRESLERRQHFQFVDLFKDQRPYPAGILSNWRVGSLLDRQSSAFLGISNGPKMCRCVCKPRREPKVPIGLSLVVLSIREVDWTQVRLAKKMTCGGLDDTT
ncbi:hypothetical protein F5Y04DRAFT_265140 [Hypomontagnella monticulosa]|nr:hypothetical protein F5Y04DRAFT_265140 [Hypomontagnella monticulosa]